MAPLSSSINSENDARFENSLDTNGGFAQISSATTSTSFLLTKIVVATVSFVALLMIVAMCVGCCDDDGEKKKKKTKVGQRPEEKRKQPLDKTTNRRRGEGEDGGDACESGEGYLTPECSKKSPHPRTSDEPSFSHMRMFPEDDDDDVKPRGEKMSALKRDSNDAESIKKKQAVALAALETILAEAARKASAKRTTMEPSVTKRKSDSGKTASSITPKTSSVIIGKKTAVGIAGKPPSPADQLRTVRQNPRDLPEPPGGVVEDAGSTLQFEFTPQRQRGQSSTPSSERSEQRSLDPPPSLIDSTSMGGNSFTAGASSFDSANVPPINNDKLRGVNGKSTTANRRGK